MRDFFQAVAIGITASFTVFAFGYMVTRMYLEHVEMVVGGAAVVAAVSAYFGWVFDWEREKS